MLVDVSSVVSWAMTESVTILRSQGRTFDQATGYYTELDPVSLTRKVHIQPITGRDMDKLRELHDVTEAVRVWSTESFELGKIGQTPQRYGVSTYDDDPSDDPVRRADQMLFRSKIWELRPILNWEPGAYYEVVATL